MPRDILKVIQSDGTTKDLEFIEEKAFLVDRAMGLLHAHGGFDRDDPLYVFPETFAKSFKVDRNIVYQEMESGALPHYYQGEDAIILKSVLRPYFNERCHPTGGLRCKGELHIIGGNTCVYVHTFKGHYFPQTVEWLNEMFKYNDKILTVSDVSRLLDKSTSEISYLLETHSIPFFDIRNMYRIPVEGFLLYFSLASSSDSRDIFYNKFTRIQHILEEILNAKR